MAKKAEKTVLGLDISSDFIRVAELEETIDGLQLNNLGIAPTPPGTIEEGIIVDPQSIASTIREILEVNGIKTKKTVSAVWGKGVILQLIDFPSTIPLEEMREVIKGKVGQYALFTNKEVVLDFQPLEGLAPQGLKTIKVLLVAVQEKLLRSYEETTRLAKLDLIAIDERSLSICRSLCYNSVSLPSAQTLASVVIGDDSTNLNVLKGTSLCFLHTIDIGNNDLAEVKGLDLEKAISPALVELSVELQHSLEFFQAQFPADKINTIVLNADFTSFKDLDKYLESKLEMKVEISNPLRNIKLYRGTLPAERLDRIAPSLTTAVGLGMWAMEKVRYKHSINLIPREEYRMVRVNRRILILVVALFLVEVFSALVITSLDIRIARITRKLSGLKDKISRIEPVLSEARDRKTALERELFLIQRIGLVPWSQILNEVKNRIPRDIWLNKIDFDSQGFIFEGATTSSRDSVFRFQQSLANSSYFQSIEMDWAKDAKIGKYGVVEFRLRCQLTKEVMSY